MPAPYFSGLGYSSSPFAPYQPPAAPATKKGVNPILPGTQTYGYNPSFGGVPSVPSPQASQQTAIGGNQMTLSDLYNLAQGTGAASAAGANQQLVQNLPGYQGLVGQSSQNIGSLLKGKIPQDVLDLLSQQAAERGIQIGSPGSPNALSSELLRYFGGSLGAQQMGEQQLSGAIGRTPQGPAFNPATMFLDPQAQQQWAYLASQLEAAPIPAAAAGANLAALNRGVGAGYGQPAAPQAAPPPPSPFGGGTPALNPYAPPSSTGGDWQQDIDGTWVNLATGERSWTDPTQAVQATQSATYDYNAPLTPAPLSDQQPYGTDLMTSPFDQSTQTGDYYDQYAFPEG